MAVQFVGRGRAHLGVGMTKRGTAGAVQAEVELDGQVALSMRLASRLADSAAVAGGRESRSSSVSPHAMAMEVSGAASGPSVDHSGQRLLQGRRGRPRHATAGARARGAAIPSAPPRRSASTGCQSRASRICEPIRQTNIKLRLVASILVDHITHSQPDATSSQHRARSLLQSMSGVSDTGEPGGTGHYVEVGCGARPGVGLHH